MSTGGGAQVLKREALLVKGALRRVEVWPLLIKYDKMGGGGGGVTRGGITTPLTVHNCSH